MCGRFVWPQASAAAEAGARLAPHAADVDEELDEAAAAVRAELQVGVPLLLDVCAWCSPRPVC